MDVYLNGKIVAPEQALIPLQDAGFQHAVGLFETMHVQNAKAFRLEAHLDRLAESAKVLGLARELDKSPLIVAVQTLIDHNRLDTARLRLTLTAGNLSLLADKPGSPPEPTVAITATPPTQYDPAYFEKGITVLIAPPGANPFDQLAGHKTLSYWGRLRTLRQAAAMDAGEAVWLSVTNHLAGGAVSNIFLVKDGVLLTPFARGEEVNGALPAPVLPGITRATIIELAAKAGIETKRQMLSVNDLLEADEVFLTNSSWQVLPVSKVEKQAVGQGGVGPITKQLRSAILELIEQETLTPEED